MLYEIRTYEAAEGRAQAMRSRFLNEVVPRMPRHGITLMGVFDDAAATGRLVYITCFADEAARARAWASFGADAEWQAVKKASEADGPLIRQQSAVQLAPALSGLPLA